MNEGSLKAVRPLKIAVIAHLRHPIAEPFAGGMEAHAWRLTKLLQSRGHDVTLFGSGDSDPTLPLEVAIPEHYDKIFPMRLWHDTPALHDWLDTTWPHIVDRVAGGKFDVIHNNSLHPAPIEWADKNRKALVTTLHVPPFHTLREAVRKASSPWTLFTVLSDQQIPLWWDAVPANVRVTPNGISLIEWPFQSEGDGTAVWFGRITPNKGTALAAQAARIAQIPLTLYGSIEDRDYFETEVVPLLDDGITYRGQLFSMPLARAVGRASVALFTPMWLEPFGLTAVEAMACGLPIAAFDNGAARAVIGPCGRYAKPGDVGALAQAIRLALDLPRAASRARVEAHFSDHAIAEAYEQAYADAIRAAA